MLTNVSISNYEQAATQLWDYLVPHLSYIDSKELEQIELAFMQMVSAHTGQQRKSGDFYIVHPVEACVFLTHMGLDADTLTACLLHDVPEDTEVGLEELSKHFNNDVVFLISGITKLSKIKYRGEDRYAENLRKMFVAMSRDLRVIFIKLADRLHNLQTLSSLSPEKASRIALESLEIYVPIAQKLGINYFKGRIEDEAFKYVYPLEYEQFISQSFTEIERRQDVVTHMKTLISSLLRENKIEDFTLKGRAKKYYSMYRKTQDKNSNLEDLRDLVALRIIVPHKDDCYEVFSLIHKHFPIVPNSTKDYIERKKDNGYQSLHIAIVNPETQEPVEIQIRTTEMHEFAEYGVAAHWAYKQRGRGQTVSEEFLDSESLKWISELVNLSQAELTQEEYLRHVKLDLFQDRIFVLTPGNDVINLPTGASPLDFAFRIHEEVGAHASLAIVNGQPMKLSGVLNNGDLVEIITAKNQKVKLDWLNIVKTRQAAAMIRSHLRKQ